MKISFENALGVHPSALQYRSRRAELIANNLVNADTPGYKARDIRFADVLDQRISNVRLNTTNKLHLAGLGGERDPNVMYRMPIQPSVDGNTVDPELEESNYMRNALQFQSSFTFLNGKFKGLSSAIRGE